MKKETHKSYMQIDKGLVSKAINSDIWVIKIGSAMITNHGAGIDRVAINDWAHQISLLKKSGKKVILVSSGAIAVGIQKLNWQKKPADLAEQQAAASVGQVTLAKVYEEIFINYGIQTAQVLLTHDDASDRKRYLNIRGTIRALLDNGIIPIINENDAVSFDEIKFGDNDNLGALVANLINAGLYVILTDQNGLYDSDPRENKGAKLIPFDYANNKSLNKFIGKSKSELGSGGMLTKIQAARKALNSGTSTVITHGQSENSIINILSGDFVGTMLYANSSVNGKKQWLAGQLQTKGRVIIDDGAETAIKTKGTSLLSVGVNQVVGEFSRGEIISISNKNNIEIARGVTNYNSLDIEKIKGLPSDEIVNILSYTLGKDIIHRDNMVLT